MPEGDSAAVARVIANTINETARGPVFHPTARSIRRRKSSHRGSRSSRRSIWFPSATQLLAMPRMIASD
jgi:hypothetical protein